MLLCGVVAAQQPKAPSPQPPPQPPPPLKPDPWLARLARFVGVPKSPPPILRDHQASPAGQIWIGSVKTGESRLLAREAVYRSPIFSNSGSELYTLRLKEVVRVDVKDGAVDPIAMAPAAFKLVGVSADGPEEILIVQLHGNEYSAWTLTVETGKLARIAGVGKDSSAMYVLTRKARYYGGARIDTESVECDDLAGKTDREAIVYFENAHAERRQVTRCADGNCTDPSLSPDRASFAYIRFRKR
jgi:hypothetical protein